MQKKASLVNHVVAKVLEIVTTQAIKDATIQLQAEARLN